MDTKLVSINISLCAKLCILLQGLFDVWLLEKLLTC